MRLPSRAPATTLRSFLVVGVVAGLLGVLAPQRAFAVDGFVGTRSLGMGETLRGAATSGTGPLLNPSGMSLTQSYNVEADYAFARTGDNHYLHASIVDSTSGYKLAGGLYYTYHSDDVSFPGHGHEVGLALSLPFGEHLSIGATGKYLRLSGDESSSGQNSSGFSYDLGITLRTGNVFSLGVVGYNLNEVNIRVAREALGYGAAISPTDFLLIAVDGVTNLSGFGEQFQYSRQTRFSAGAELFLEKKAALRVGGGYDGVTQNGFFTVGLSAVSEAGALDFGLRQDVFQGGAVPRNTVLGASVRLFVPQP
jgi:hypothetical protein